MESIKKSKKSNKKNATAKYTYEDIIQSINSNDYCDFFVGQGNIGKLVYVQKRSKNKRYNVLANGYYCTKDGKLKKFKDGKEEDGVQLYSKIKHIIQKILLNVKKEWNKKLLDLTYRQNVDYEKMNADFSKYIILLKNYFKMKNVDIEWLRLYELSKECKWHIHMVLFFEDYKITEQDLNKLLKIWRDTIYGGDTSKLNKNRKPGGIFVKDVPTIKGLLNYYGKKKFYPDLYPKNKMILSASSNLMKITKLEGKAKNLLFLAGSDKTQVLSNEAHIFKNKKFENIIIKETFKVDREKIKENANFIKQRLEKGKNRKLKKVESKHKMMKFLIDEMYECNDTKYTKFGIEYYTLQKMFKDNAIIVWLDTGYSRKTKRGWYKAEITYNMNITNYSSDNLKATSYSAFYKAFNKFVKNYVFRDRDIVLISRGNKGIKNGRSGKGKYIKKFNTIMKELKNRKCNLYSIALIN